MRVVRPPRIPVSCDPGIVWPTTGDDDVSVLGDPFGHRAFTGGTGHATGVDFHRGIDMKVREDGPGEPANSGGCPIVSPIHGRVVREYYGHFEFYDDGNMDQLEEVDPGGKATFSASAGILTIVGKNNGVPATTADIPRLRKITAFDAGQSGNDWYVQMEVKAGFAPANGEVVFGIQDRGSAETQYITWNGDRMTAYMNMPPVGAGGGNTFTGGSRPTYRYFRIGMVSGVLWVWDSVDGVTWEHGTGYTGTWTNPSNFELFIGWMSAASGADETVQIEFFGGGDNSTVARFGNWVTIATASHKYVLMHFRHLYVARGDEVRPGDVIGLTGRTGFDQRSGPVLYNHCHFEYHPNNSSDYSNADATNPLSASILPRADTTVDVTVVRDSANDPNGGGNACHRLTITVDRNTYQNFQLNEFSLTGNSATRTLNWNTRAGLDPADQDKNNYNGVYFEPLAFDENDDQYIFKIYFVKATVGATFASAYVKDADGNTLWSE